MSKDRGGTLIFYNYINGDVDVLVPVYGYEIDDTAFYVNLNSNKNKELLGDLTPDEKTYLLIDQHNGRLITKGAGRHMLTHYWNLELRRRYHAWIDKHFKKYAEQCANYFARIKEITDEE